MKDFESILSHFGSKVKRISENTALVCCPVHGDINPSLQITRHSDRYGFFCWSCSEQGNRQHNTEVLKGILDAVGLTWEDIGPNTNSKRQTWTEYVEKRVSEQEKERCRFRARYDYFTPSGEYAFSRLRFEKQADKVLRYAVFDFTSDGERATLGLKGKRREDFPDAVYAPNITAFRAAVADGLPVFYAEGEKDVDRLCNMGFPAVTCGSANDWRKECTPLFNSADLIISADNDEPGAKLARQIAADLKETARRIRIVTPCTEKSGGDISDFFDAGHSAEDLEELIQKAYAELPLDRFHLIGRNGAVTGVKDFAVFKYLCSVENICIIGGTPYIYRFGYYQADENGSMLKTMIRRLIYPDLIKSTTIERIYKLFLSAEELQTKPEEMNQYPVEWVNFRNGFYDPVSMQMIPHQAAYRATTQIPRILEQKDDLSFDEVSSWLDFICAGDKESRKMLLQYCGYCFTRDTRQQKMLILDGEGGTGKSTLIRLLESAIGSRNISNISLAELTQRFASFGLFGKTLNSCADLETTALEDTSTLKKILGEDTLRAEQKGKDAISFKSFAKLIFSTNELPIVKGERTNGFYRRLLILPMNNKPGKVDTHLFDKLSQHIDAFIALCLDALSEMYIDGNILESDASKEAVLTLRKASDTVAAFLAEYTEPDPKAYEKRSAMYQRYCDFCRNAGRTPLTKTKFFQSMEKKNLDCHSNTMHGIRIIKGLRLLSVPVEDFD